MSDFTPRYEGIDTDHLAWMLVAVDGRIRSRMDDTDYRLWEDYHQRAQLRYGAGAPLHEVVDDLWNAARCLRFQEKLHFSKVPVERLRPRRILPIELAVLGGEFRLARQVAESYGIPISTLAADMASAELKDEVRYVTRFFDGYLRGPLDLAGLGALMYSGALACLLRGFDDEALLGVRIFRQARRTLGPEAAGPDPHVRRYGRLLDMVECLAKERDAELVTQIAALVLEVEPALRAGMSPEQWAKPPGTPAYLDPSPVCFVALATYRERMLPLEALPAALGPHRELLETLCTPVVRNLEEEESAARAQVQALLEQAEAVQSELAHGQESGKEGAGAPL